MGIAVGMLGHQSLIAQQAPVTRTILQQRDLEGSVGREVIMFRAEIVPGGMAGRHYHPGPELFDVLEGALTLEPDGHPPVTLKAGESGYGPAKHIHNAKNASTTEPVKVIGFLVGEKGLGYAYALSGRVDDAIPLLRQGVESDVSMKRWAATRCSSRG